MEVTERQRRLLALCAIRVDGASVDWSLIARQAQFEEGLDALWAGRIFEKSAAAKRSLPVLRRGIRDAEPLANRVEAEIQAAERAAAGLITVLDEPYPANLRLIPEPAAVPLLPGRPGRGRRIVRGRRGHAQRV